MEKIVREISDKPPAHYLWKIENFSKLSNAEEPYFKSGEFYVDEYKWKLALYIGSIGNKKLSNGKGHIWLGLQPYSSTSLPFYHKAWASFKLFVYDQIRDNYLSVHEDMKVRPIHGAETGWGFNLLPLNDFYDASKGYLIDDCCIFGAEVNVKDVHITKRVDCTRLSKELSDKNSTYTWKIKNFKKKLEGSGHLYEDFSMCGHKWRMSLHKGWNEEKKCSLSLAICLKDLKKLKYSETLNAEFGVLLKDQVYGEDHKQNGRKCFSERTSWEFKDFIPLSQLDDKSKGFVCNGAVVFQVVISYIAITKRSI